MALLGIHLNYNLTKYHTNTRGIREPLSLSGDPSLPDAKLKKLPIFPGTPMVHYKLPMSSVLSTVLCSGHSIDNWL